MASSNKDFSYILEKIAGTPRVLRWFEKELNTAILSLMQMEELEKARKADQDEYVLELDDGTIVDVILD